MKIAEYSYHEMKKVWSDFQYVDKTQSQFDKPFYAILKDFESKTLKEFLRPYMWKPNDEKQLVQTSNSLLDREAKLWITMTFYNPLSKYGETYESQMFEFGSTVVDTDVPLQRYITEIIWGKLNNPYKKFPPIASVRIEIR